MLSFTEDYYKLIIHSSILQKEYFLATTSLVVSLVLVFSHVSQYFHDSINMKIGSRVRLKTEYIFTFDNNMFLPNTKHEIAYQNV